MISFKNSLTPRARKAGLMLAILVGFACGPDNYDEYISYFLPESSNAKPEDQRYFFSLGLYQSADLYSDYSDEDTIRVDDNIRAWVAYLGGSLRAEKVSEALYKGQSAALAQLNAQLDRKHPAAKAYVAFARQTDWGDQSPWDDPSASAADSLRRLQWMATAQQAYQTETDPFLKERYAFQAVKLAAETDNPKEVQRLYDKLMVPLPRKTLISDYALCRRAGASLALGDTARAIYEFAQVFDRCPDRRLAAERSLRQHGIQFREEALSFAKTDTERAAVYALCALQPRQDALPLLEKLVDLQPNNPLVELVMTREINRNEYYFFAKPNGEPPYFETQSDSLAYRERLKAAPAYSDQLRAFAQKATENSALKNRAFWLTAAAYLAYLGNDFKAAKASLEEAQSQPNLSEPLRQQISLQQMLLLAEQTETVTPEVEQQLIGYLETFGKPADFRLNNAFVKLCNTFADKYEGVKSTEKGGLLSGCSTKKSALDAPAVAKSYLLRLLTTGHRQERDYFANMTDEQTLNNQTEPDTLRQVAAYLEQPKDDFDKRLIRLSELTLDQVNLLLGRRLMANHRYAEAAEAWAKLDAEVWKDEAFETYFGRNPFDVQLPTKRPTTNPYTPLTFARRMAELAEQAANAQGNQAAELYYQLGCGAWNMSWYGNAWLTTHAAWSSGEPTMYLYELGDKAAQEKGYERALSNDYYTTSRAQQYFEQAAKLAQGAYQADRATYMAARCEANRFGVRQAVEMARSGHYYTDDPAFVQRMNELRKKEYGTLFATFDQKHTKGQFHNEMMGQCGLYVHFLKTGGDPNLPEEDSY